MNKGNSLFISDIAILLDLYLSPTEKVKNLQERYKEEEKTMKPEVKLKFIPKCQCPIHPVVLSTLGVVVACKECGQLYETLFEIHNLGKEKEDE